MEPVRLDSGGRSRNLSTQEATQSDDKDVSKPGALTRDQKEKRVSVNNNLTEPNSAETLSLCCASPEERARVGQFIERANKNPTGPRLKVAGEELAFDHPNELVGAALVGEALGSANSDFLSGFIGQLATLASPGRKTDEARLNFIVSMIKDNQPRDQNEAMLAGQMAAVHLATMSFAGYLARANNLAELDSYQRGLNALARTFVTQLEALRRYRTGGEQKVTVTHVAPQDAAQPIARRSVERWHQRTADLRSTPTNSPAPVVPLRPQPAAVALNNGERRGEQKVTGDEPQNTGSDPEPSEEALFQGEDEKK
jgi:hypothetical protein